jgi:hypothetical protein
MCSPAQAGNNLDQPVQADGAGQAAAVPPAEGGEAAAGLAATSVAAEMAMPPPPPPITLVLSADLSLQRLTVTERGDVKHVWPISSGRRGYATKTGTFRPQWMARMWYSRQYEWSPMPHAVFFNRGTAFHATSAVGLLGRPASHGCIRLAPANAARLYALVQRHGFAQTKVVVHGTPKEPAVARRSPARQQVAGAGVYQARRVSRYAPLGAPFWPF